MNGPAQPQMAAPAVIGRPRPPRRRKVPRTIDEIPETYDWLHPAYAPIFHARAKLLHKIRENPDKHIPVLKAHYKNNPGQIIVDWGMTFDPRNADINLPTVIPFVLFPKQMDFIQFVVRKWKERRRGMIEKSRDMGASWLATSLGCDLCLHNDGLAIGYGSRVVDLVDKIGTMKPLLPKARFFMRHLPVEFRGGWEEWRDAPYMRLNFPETGSMMMGEGGDNIGRGDRASIYMVDEAAYLERAEMIEHSLSQTTNCRIDMSSVKTNTVFAKNRHEGKIEVLIMDWHDDPRKDEAWYARIQEDYDPVTIAQEVDRDYSASVTGIVIPGEWARACLGAREKLGIAVSGGRVTALDVADEGVDTNSIVSLRGIEIDHLSEWSGKGSDIHATVGKAFDICDEIGAKSLRYDADGLGAGVRGDARVINEQRRANKLAPVGVRGFRGSGAVVDPDKPVYETREAQGPARTNADYFHNLKAQGWWNLRRRSYNTWKWVTQGVACDPNEILSIRKELPLAQKLVGELSQVTYEASGTGKMKINKKPGGTTSPNLGDGVMMRFAKLGGAPLIITDQLLAAVQASGGQRRRG